MNMSLSSSELEKRRRMGKVLLSWDIQPKSSFKGLGIVLSLLGILIWIGFLNADKVFPQIKKIPTFVLYLIPFLIGPISNWIKKKSKTQSWSLYEHGLLFAMKEKEKTVQDKFWKWQDFKRAEYQSQYVLLYPKIPFQLKIKIPSQNNTMSVYMICRERISIASSKSMESKFTAPQAPDTREQRHIRKLENQVLDEHIKSQLTVMKKR